jgi:NADPH:quinone reductase
VARGLGARTVAVVSTQEKADFVRALGAEEVLLVDGFLAGVKELTGGRGVDVVVDVVGGGLMTDSLRAMGPLGRLLVIGFTAGSIPEVRVNRLLLNNIDVRGVGWGAYAMVRPGFMREQWDALLPMVESGAVDPPVGATLPFEQVAAALTEMAERRVLGKTVLTF